MNEQPNPPPSETKNDFFARFKQSRAQWLVASVVFFIIVIGSVLLLTNNKQDDNNTQNQNATTFKNWLKPTSEIMVGSNRYKSPCMVLPQKAATDIFGEFNSESFVQEEFLDQSSSDSTNKSVKALCQYWYASSQAQIVTLDTEQFADNKDLKYLTRVMGERASDAQEALEVYKKAVAGTNDDKLVEFMSNLDKSVATYTQDEKAYLSGKPTSTNHDGVIIPSRYSESSDKFSFKVIYGNTVYTLTQELPLSANKDIAKMMSMAQKSLDQIAPNAKNEKLDQSPSPTIIGTTDKNGSTTILEPCSVLSPAVFATISGLAQNQLVKRTSLKQDVQKKRYGKIDKIQILPGSSCSRGSDNAGHTQNTSVGINLRVAASLTEANEWAANNMKIVDGKDIALSTSADRAGRFANEIDPSVPVYMFQTGPYIVTVDISTLLSGNIGDKISSSQGSQEQYIKAINELVATIKKQL